MEEPSIPAPNPVQIQFHYIKSPDYREVPCHGILGGATPTGQLWMAIFSERAPIPQTVEFTVPPPDPNTGRVVIDETKEAPTQVDGRKGFIRHISFSTYMDIETAKRFHSWLGNQLAQQAGQ